MKRGLSANSIIIFWGLNVADCHVGDKRSCCLLLLALLNLFGAQEEEELSNTVSVFGKALHVSAVEMHHLCRLPLACFSFFISTFLLCICSVIAERCCSYFAKVSFRLFRTGRRYPPSSRQTSHEEGKEWLRSHSTGGLQDTGSQSPMSPPGASCTTAGKYHYSNLCRSTVPPYMNNVATI